MDWIKIVKENKKPKLMPRFEAQTTGQMGEGLS